MALTLTAANIRYDVTTTPQAIRQPYGGRPWTIGNMAGSSLFVRVAPSQDAEVTTHTGTAAQLRGSVAAKLSQIEIPPFSRAIIPADVPAVSIVSATGTLATAVVQAGEQDPPEPAYVSAELDVPAAASTLIVADPGANHQIWLYAAHIQAAALATVTFEDGALTNLSGDIPVGANGGFVWPHTRTPTAPWLRCTASEALHVLTVGAGGTGDGQFIYADVVV